VKEVRCPRCAKRAPFSAQNPWRPFCSERCKMIDLGAWAAESYRVPIADETPGSEPDPSEER
jgi:uncharacterized protein